MLNCELMNLESPPGDASEYLVWATFVLKETQCPPCSSLGTKQKDGYYNGESRS